MIARDLETAQLHHDSVTELRLVDAGKISLPDWVWEMPHLELLDLSGNNLIREDLEFGRLLPDCQHCGHER